LHNILKVSFSAFENNKNVYKINFSNQTTSCKDVELQKANEELICANKKLENNIIVSR
jgi:hypothetical protein